MQSGSSKPQSIDDYIAAFPDEVQEVLQQIRTTIRDGAPEAEETISYGIPTFKLNGRYLIYFAAYQRHASLYPQVIVPLARPALLTVLILEFQGMWNKFLEPLLYLNTADKYVLNVALSIFQQQFKAQWNLTLVGAMFNAIPVLILFFIFSRYYIEGVAYTGIKG